MTKKENKLARQRFKDFLLSAVKAILLCLVLQAYRENSLIDLARFREVTPSEDGASVIIGAGARWMDVSEILDKEGLAVVGGRHSAVGVGGLILGDNLSLSTRRLPGIASDKG